MEVRYLSFFSSVLTEFGTMSLTASLLIADDGKLFHGSGVGDPFGPRCFEGDIMGCGIMFPRDFNIDGGGEGFVSYSTPP